MKLNRDTFDKGFILPIILVSVMFMITGCGDFFAEKPTEIESKEILQELEQVKESPFTQNPLPSMYRQPTQRLTIKDGVKLFYFTKHHPAADLAALVQQQMGVQFTINGAINQIVLFCKDDMQADAVQRYLELIDVPPIQVNIDCLIVERYGDVTMDWETTLFVENLFGEGITLGEDKYPKPAFPGASLRERERSTFGLDVGYWKNKGVEGHQVRAVVDMLVSRGYLKILMNPQLESINGKKATVTIKDYAPIEEVQTGAAGTSSVYNITKYVWVPNTLTVTPYVYSDGSIGLTTNIIIGSRSKPEGVVQRAIITERSINVEENRITPGMSLIIGGMRKSEKRSVVRGVPFLKDLPIVGILFSSKDFEESGTEIIFILTPSISSGAIKNTQMVEYIRGKYVEPEYKKWLSDYFGKDPYTQIIEKQAAEAELARVRAQLDMEQAQLQAQTAQEHAQQASVQADEARKQAEQLHEKARLASEEAQKAAQLEAEAKSQTQAEKEKVAQLEAEKQKTLEEAQKARDEAQQAASQSEQTSQNAQKLQIEAQEAQAQLEKSLKAVEEAKQKAAQRQAELEAEKVRKASEEEAKRKAAEDEAKRLEEEARKAAESQAGQSQAEPPVTVEPSQAESTPSPAP